MKTLIFLCMLAAASMAAEYTPEAAAAYAVKNSRDLRVARFVIAEAEGRLVQAGLWTNPEFEFRADLTAGKAYGDRTFEAGFMQRFPWSGRLKYARASARVDVAMAVEELRDKERQLAGVVLGKARALLVLDKQLALNEENRSLLERIFKQTTNLAAAGEASVVDARVVELERTTLGLSREALLVEKSARLAELNGLMGRNPGEPLEVTGPLPAVPSANTMSTAAALAVSRRPDRRLAALQVDKASAEKQLARAGTWEDVGAGIIVSQERRDGMEETMVGFSVSVPLPLWNKQQGRIAETAASWSKAAAGVDAVDLAINAEVREAESRVKGLAAILNRTRGPALELARSNTKLVEETYASGKASFLTVFESRKQRLAIEDSALSTEAQLAAAVTDWESRTGFFPPVVRDALAHPRAASSLSKGSAKRR